jgi:hypothetical protein
MELSLELGDLAALSYTKIVVLVRLVQMDSG